MFIEMVQEGLGLHMEWWHQFLIMDLLHPQFSISPLGSTHYLIQHMGNFYTRYGHFHVELVIYYEHFYILLVCPFL